MKPNEILKQQFLEIVDNQLDSNDPPETRQTLERLKKEGYSDADARLLIAQCVAAEMFNVMKHNEPYNSKRYVSNLNALPEPPSE
ncbi:MAG: hypothetical protein KDD10_04975 [Phaeodactylibacter sp.]|nr:hypothetical protein [Phaeodactylibacter sp.]MCB9297058.1 hypothetical protein [Lewinellaceae bacterium]